MKMFVTFGQVHVHSLSGRTFDRNSVAVIDCENEDVGRNTAFELFNGVFHMCTPDMPDMSYYPRGLINVEKGKT